MQRRQITDKFTNMLITGEPLFLQKDDLVLVEQNDEVVGGIVMEMLQTNNGRSVSYRVEMHDGFIPSGELVTQRASLCVLKKKYPWSLA